MTTIYIFAGIVFIIGLIVKSPWFKGFVGESLVNTTSSIGLGKQYHIIKNVTVPTEDGTTQIDHVIVSVYGIFVVETKNYKGWIFGKEKDKYWTQKIYRKTNKFQNPLRQNYKHTKTLSDLLEISHDKFISIVFFAGESTFKTIMPENVISDGGYYLRYIKRHKEEVLTEEEVNQIIDSIQRIRLKPSFKTDRKHVRNLRKRAN